LLGRHQSHKREYRSSIGLSEGGPAKRFRHCPRAKIARPVEASENAAPKAINRMSREYELVCGMTRQLQGACARPCASPTSSSAPTLATRTALCVVCIDRLVPDRHAHLQARTSLVPPSRADPNHAASISMTATAPASTTMTGSAPCQPARRQRSCPASCVRQLRQPPLCRPPSASPKPTAGPSSRPIRSLHKVGHRRARRAGYPSTKKPSSSTASSSRCETWSNACPASASLHWSAQERS
jgi:hypothetical protein